MGPSPSPLTVNRGRGQRGGRVPSWQENCYFATAPRVTPSPFSMLQQIQIAAPCPVSSETGVFLQRYTSVSSIFFKFPLSFFIFYFEKQKRRMRVFHPPRRLDAKKFLIRLFVIQFFLVCRVKTSPTWVRAPPKSWKYLRFVIFLSPCQSAKKGQKTG